MGKPSNLRSLEPENLPALYKKIEKVAMQLFEGAVLVTVLDCIIFMLLFFAISVMF